MTSLLAALTAVGLEVPSWTLQPGSPQAGAIRGRVELATVPRGSDRRPAVAALGAPPRRDRVARRRSVVYLATAPEGGASEPGRAVMDQRNETFMPHVLAITTGTVVDFPNSDRIYHNVFSLSKVRPFDLGRYASGASKSVRFDRPGVVRVFCDIHSHMNAFILVFNHPFFAITDEDGRFQMTNVPAGRHPVVAWHEGDASSPRFVIVPPGGTTEINFTLP